MKILHVIESMSPRYGGPVGVLKSLSRAQATLGHEVSIVTTDTDYPAGTLDVPLNSPTTDCGVSTTYFGVQFRALNLSLPMARALPGIIAAHDITHVHGLYRFPPTYAASAARFKKKPYIIRSFGALDPFMYARSSKSRMLKRFYESLFDLPNLRAASAIHFTTEDERDLAGHLDLKAPSFVIPNGLDWQPYKTLPAPGGFRARLGIGPDTPLVLFLGRINFKKGLDILIPAFAQTRSSVPGAKLAIVGPDNEGYGATVRKLVTENSLADSVIFVDMLNGDQVREAFVDANIFSLPSYTENFGMTVIESLGCATPVVISDQVNIHREVSASGSGLVTPCDAVQVSAAMTSLLLDEDRRKAMGALGRSFVASHYAWPHIVERLDDEYRAAIARHRKI
jgi:glycosyltransferase involved in cell wall biosynthesis